MPPKMVTELCERVAKLEARVEHLIMHEKWSIGMLSAVVVGVALNLLK
jgi:hypothetical protein